MTDGEFLVRYSRQGGRPPPDDERLVVVVDGSFAARRTVAGHRIGRFRGRLTGAGFDALRAAVDLARAAGDLFVATPIDGATETTEIDGGTATTGSNEQPSGGWAALVTRLRGLVDEAVDEEPLAAVELRATAGEAGLIHVGGEPVEVDRASVLVRAVRLDEEGLVLGRWNGSVVPPQVEDAPGGSAGPDWLSAGPGWSLPLPFRHGIELAPSDWLQVWVHAAIRDEGRVRAARFYRAVQADPG